MKSHRHHQKSHEISSDGDNRGKIRDHIRDGMSWVLQRDDIKDHMGDEIGDCNNVLASFFLNFNLKLLCKCLDQKPAGSPYSLVEDQQV